MKVEFGKNPLVLAFEHYGKVVSLTVRNEEDIVELVFKKETDIDYLIYQLNHLKNAYLPLLKEIE